MNIFEIFEGGSFERKHEMTKLLKQVTVFSRISAYAQISASPE